MTHVKTQRRTYQSVHRQRQVAATRLAILEAARALFRERGYANATIEAIAAQAGVAAPTVYKHFDSKRRLLLALIEQTINVRVPPQLDAVLGEAAPRSRLAALARMCVDLASAAPDVVAVALSAANADAELGEMFREMAEGRRRSAELIAQSLARGESLRSDCSVERARDVLFALASPDLYEVLVIRFGWSDAQFEEWLSATLASSLLGAPTDSGV
ncbi:MAG: TetR/AcrR family transcriptional regulator [Chloroflexi bacterium]|nr:TetR/AcrR family transcriptional regulator [Chloroflexota bacterium]